MGNRLSEGEDTLAFGEGVRSDYSKSIRLLPSFHLGAFRTELIIASLSPCKSLASTIHVNCIGCPVDIR